MATYLITGATGRQGGSTARLLLNADERVHVLVRRPDGSEAQSLARAGATIFPGDYEDVDAIAKALEDVTAVFFNPPYPGPKFVDACKTFLQTCAAQKTVKTVVVSSAAGVEKYDERVNVPHQQYWAMKAAVEDIVRGLSFENTTILRPPFLMHGYLPPASGMLFPQLAKERKFVTSLHPETKVPHLRAEDVGIFASTVLRSPEKFNGRAISMAAENLTAQGICNVMSEVAGVQIELQGSQSDTGSPIQGYHDWTNAVDASIDADALREEFGDGMMDLRSFLMANKSELLETLGAGT